MSRKRVLTEQQALEIGRMKYVLDMKNRDIAKEMGIIEQTVSAYVNSPEMREQFRDCIIRKWEEKNELYASVARMKRRGCSWEEIKEKTGVNLGKFGYAEERYKETGYYFPKPFEDLDERRQKRKPIFAIRNVQSGRYVAEIENNRLKVKHFDCIKQAQKFRAKNNLKAAAFQIELVAYLVKKKSNESNEE